MFMFKIKCTKWTEIKTKSTSEKGVTKLYFMQDDASMKSMQESQDWMVAIEYLRTKCTYD